VDVKSSSPQDIKERVRSKSSSFRLLSWEEEDDEVEEDEVIDVVKRFECGRFRTLRCGVVGWGCCCGGVVDEGGLFGDEVVVVVVVVMMW